jgi:hypothetical protein
MEPGYVIALDTHRAFTEVVVMTATGRVRLRRRVVTALPELRSLIEEVRRPRHVVLEEGPLADWLLRGLEGVADVVTACDPRRNAHIAKDGDKDDPIDAEKLGHLYRGGFINPVHHPATLERAAFKQLVGLYHERVRNLVRHGQRIAAQFGQHGVFVRQPVFTHWAEREALLGHLPSPSLRVGVGMLLEEFDLARDVFRLRRHAVAFCQQGGPVALHGNRPGTPPQWRRPRELAGAAGVPHLSALEKHDSRHGAAGDHGPRGAVCPTL